MDNEDLRALLNAGYKRTATVARCVGDAKSMNVTRFPVYAPVALAGIAGGMPATITTRAVTIHRRKRRYDEVVEEFIEEDVEREAAPVHADLEAWTLRVADDVARARPERPERRARPGRRNLASAPRPRRRCGRALAADRAQGMPSLRGRGGATRRLNRGPTARGHPRHLHDAQDGSHG